MVYKRGLVYWYDFWFQGERYVGSSKLRNKLKAETAENKLKTDLAMGLFGLAPTKAAPIAKAFLEGEFLEKTRNRSKGKPRTVKYYEEKVRRLLEFPDLANARLNLIDERLIEDYILYRSKCSRRSHGKGLVSPGSINGELRALRKALRNAKDWKHIKDVPRIRQLPGDVQREYILTGTLENQYLALAEYPLREAAVLLLDTGLRPDELVRLRKSDVALEHSRLRITSGKTKNAARTLSIPPRSLEVIRLMYDFFPDSEWVFPGQRKGKHLTVWALDNLHAKLRKETLTSDGTPLFPKDFVVYSLRHTYGTRLAESGCDAFTIMRLMGHSSVKVSERYIHMTPEHLERAMKRKEAYDMMLRGETVPADFPQGTVPGTDRTGKLL